MIELLSILAWLFLGYVGSAFGIAGAYVPTRYPDLNERFKKMDYQMGLVMSLLGLGNFIAGLLFYFFVGNGIRPNWRWPTGEETGKV